MVVQMKTNKYRIKPYEKLPICCSFCYYDKYCCTFLECIKTEAIKGIAIPFFLKNMEVQAKVAEITKDEVKHVADLARLEITEEEAGQFTEHLSAIITYAEQLNELDTEGVVPTTHVLDLKNVFRQDEVKRTITQEDAMKNAPDSEDGQFRVPSILE